jgi:cytochrome c oxidase cbb3-type subunit 3
MSETPNTPEQEREDILLDHSYDGIQEFDNPLPGWWKAIFWASILFAVPYTYWYHFADGNSIYDQYEADVAAKLEREGLKPPVASDAAGLLAAMNNPAAMERGKSKYSTICLACHAPDGGGVAGLGPNMCDDNYKNITKIEDFVGVITNGVPGTAMAGQPLSAREIVDVAAYVASLRGTTPANPKDPEGEVIAPWSAE